MTGDRILTLHPAGKHGVNIELDKYKIVKKAIEECLARRGEATFSALGDDVTAAIGDSFDGSVMWYYTSVKMDMEARGLIERIPGTKPYEVRLITQKEGK